MLIFLEFYIYTLLKFNIGLKCMRKYMFYEFVFFKCNFESYTYLYRTISQKVIWYRVYLGKNILFKLVKILRATCKF